MRELCAGAQGLTSQGRAGLAVEKHPGTWGYTSRANEGLTEQVGEAPLVVALPGGGPGPLWAGPLMDLDLGVVVVVVVAATLTAAVLTTTTQGVAVTLDDTGTAVGATSLMTAVAAT